MSHYFAFVFPLFYLDPGSGSFLIQLLLAIGLGAGVAVRMFWGRILSFFKGNRGNQQADSSTSPDEDDED